MNNEHNPIAIRIRKIQELWNNQSSQALDARIFVLNYEQEDNFLVESFINIEATEHGLSNDIFLVFKARLDSEGDLLHTLSEQWLQAYERDVEKNPDWDWLKLTEKKESLKHIKKEDTLSLYAFWRGLLNDFKVFGGLAHNRIVLTLVLEYIDSLDLLRKTLKSFSEQLPEFAALLLLESRGDTTYSSIALELEEKGCLLTLPNLDTASACKELATQGDVNDPHVQYRKLLFELGELTSKGQNTKIKQLAEGKFLPLCRSMVDPQVWASGYLVVAGFMMHFEKEYEYVHRLLNKGLAVIQGATPLDEPLKFASLTIQLYMYQAATYSMANEYPEATAAFTKALELSKTAGDTNQIINCYNSILLVLLKREYRHYGVMLQEAFDYAYSLRDEELHLINISFIVGAYISKIEGINSNDKREITARMQMLYGDHWQDSPKEAMRRIEASLHTPQ